MATVVTWHSLSQSAKACRSLVNVGKLRIAGLARSSRTAAYTAVAPTSKPAASGLTVFGCAVRLPVRRRLRRAMGETSTVNRVKRPRREQQAFSLSGWPAPAPASVDLTNDYATSLGTKLDNGFALRRIHQ